MTENYRPASEPPWTEPMPPPAPGPSQWAEPVLPAAPQAAGDQPGTADVVRDQAADLSSSGVEAGKHAVGVAQEQASNVAAEATRQGLDLLRQAQEELGEQAAQGQQRLATELLSLSDELTAMAEGSTQNGAAAHLARQAASRARDAGQWLNDRGPAQVIDDVQAFARRRPGLFLALAAGTGLVAGRLTRGLAAAASDNNEPAPAPARQPEPAGQWAQPTAGPGFQSGTADLGYQPDAASAGYQAEGAADGYYPESAYFAGDDRVVNPLDDERLPARDDASARAADGLSGERDDLGTDWGSREGLR